MEVKESCRYESTKVTCFNSAKGIVPKEKLHGYITTLIQKNTNNRHQLFQSSQYINDT